MVSGKTHDVGVEYRKQAEKPMPEANRHESEEKWAWERDGERENP